MLVQTIDRSDKQTQSQGSYAVMGLWRHNQAYHVSDLTKSITIIKNQDRNTTKNHFKLIAIFVSSYF
jgi:hypothetical protein